MGKKNTNKRPPSPLAPRNTRRRTINPDIIGEEQADSSDDGVEPSRKVLKQQQQQRQKEERARKAALAAIRASGWASSMFHRRRALL